MPKTLYEVLQWAKENGEVKAVDRIRVFVLPNALREGVILAAVNPKTACSREFLAEVRKAAEAVVGKPCPN
ncbi:MAG: hypothetical protein HYV63_23520 [Candidatus Schekmanbacteria bacterium]|nr:hypothetical protein [Candidatus Schekmanbacteria bacterium]